MIKEILDGIRLGLKEMLISANRFMNNAAMAGSKDASEVALYHSKNIQKCLDGKLGTEL